MSGLMDKGKHICPLTSSSSQSGGGEKNSNVGSYTLYIYWEVLGLYLYLLVKDHLYDKQSYETLNFNKYITHFKIK